MYAAAIALLLQRISISVAALLIGSLLVGGCGFNLGNKWGSRTPLIRPHVHDDDDGQGGRRRPFRADGPDADAPPTPAPSPSAALGPALDGSAAAGDDDTIRYSSTGERLLNNAQEW